MTRNRSSRAHLLALVAMVAGLAALTTGCPGPEDIYGYNTVIFANQSDFLVERLFIIPNGAVSDGPDYLSQSGVVLPGDGVGFPGLENSCYTLKIQYRDQFTGETGSSEITGVCLFWGKEFYWYWYGPEEPDPGTDPIDDPATDTETDPPA